MLIKFTYGDKQEENIKDEFGGYFDEIIKNLKESK